MASIFYVRHQAAGVLHDYPFAAPPTKEQRDALASICFRSHGETHPKSKKKYWLRVVEVPVLGTSDEVKEPDLVPANMGGEAGAQQFEVSGTGTVTQPEER